MIITQDMMHPDNLETTLNAVLDYPYKDIKIQFSDCLGYTQKEKVLVYLIFWSKLIKYGIPVDSSITIKGDLFSQNAITGELASKTFTRLVEHGEYMYNALIEVYYALEELANYIRRHCSSHISTLSMLDIIDIYDIPEFKQIKQDLSTITNKTPSDVVELRVAEATDRMMDILGSDKNPNTNIRTSIRLGLFKTSSLAQMLLMCGPRTDVDDTIITYPVTSCYMDGLKDAKDYVIDTLTAKKSAFYLKSAVADSEYFARKQQLIMLAIKYAYPGDCGTKITIPYFITEQNYRSIAGTWIMKDDTLTRVSFDDCKSYIGTTVNLRSPLACRHRNGICAICGGALNERTLPDVNLGIQAVTKLLQDTSQRVIGTKHIQSTNTKVYTLDMSLKQWLTMRDNQIVAKRSCHDTIRNWRIGINTNDAKFINNLKNKSLDVNTINLSHFSTIRSIIISDMRTKEDTNQVIQMGNMNKYPYLSRDMLEYIQDNNDKVIIRNNFIWIDLSEFDSKNKALMDTIVTNDGVILFSHRVKAFLQSDISEYTNAIKALEDFANIVFTKAKDISITNIGAVLKAYMYTDTYDMTIPIMTDPEHVLFGNTVTINKRRSFGQLVAFEGMKDMLFRPETYCVPKNTSVFDTYLIP